VIELLVALLGPILKVTPAPPPVPEGATGVAVFRSSERYLSYRFLLAWLSMLPVYLPVIAVAAGLGAAVHKGELPLWVAIVFPGLYFVVVTFFVALSLVSIRLDYEFHCYVVTDRALRIRQGIWDQVEATLTFANVQNVRVVQGPLERYFGIASVVVDTAGGAAKTGEQKTPRGLIRGIENAGELRDRIMDRMKASRSAGLGDPDDPEHGHGDPARLPLDLLREIRDEARGLAADVARGVSLR
jgi:membrane protein YdbS with pleckstrin-like domain